MLRSLVGRATLCATLCVWGVSVGAGLLAVHSYESRPGPAGDPRSVWPEGTRIERDPRHPNLVMIAHPRCPCTRASLEELSRLVDRVREPLAVHVVFFAPGPDEERWEPTESWQRASAIPGVRVYEDPDGIEAARFGAETSGSVFLYDGAGTLQFAGGITPARGMEGKSAGAEAVFARLTGASEPAPAAPVFGCLIRNTVQGRRGQ